MFEQNIGEAKSTIRELALNEVEVVSGGDGPILPPAPIIIVSPGPGDEPILPRPHL